MRHGEKGREREEEDGRMDSNNERTVSDVSQAPEIKEKIYFLPGPSKRNAWTVQEENGAVWEFTLWVKCLSAWGWTFFINQFSLKEKKKIIKKKQSFKKIYLNVLVGFQRH